MIEKFDKNKIKAFFRDKKINLHVFEYCNMKCKYCFRNKDINNNLKIDYIKLVDWVESLGVKEINIAGGEPTLASYLITMIDYMKSKEMVVSIISNGLLIAENDQLLDELIQRVKYIGISVDSLDESINQKIGRNVGKKTLTLKMLQKISKKCFEAKVGFKINTVVSALNKDDHSLEQLKLINIDRYKLLFNHSNNYEITENEFEVFYHRMIPTIKNKIVKEGKESMDNSYIILNGDGTVALERDIFFPIEDWDKLDKSIDKFNLDDYDKRYE